MEPATAGYAVMIRDFRLQMQEMMLLENGAHHLEMAEMVLLEMLEMNTLLLRAVTKEQKARLKKRKKFLKHMKISARSALRH
jgi:hypothetical protein